MDLTKINHLPEVLVGEIFYFLPLKSLSLTNKNNWEKYYKIKSSSEIMKLSSYWRQLLRYDNVFVFKHYLDCMFNYLIKQKRIIYQDRIMRNRGLVFKRIKTKSNKWTN